MSGLTKIYYLVADVWDYLIKPAAGPALYLSLGILIGITL